MTSTESIAPARTSNSPPNRDLLPPSATPSPLKHQLASRLRLVLLDVGLDQELAGWISPTANALSFADLSTKQADRLVCVLEDLVGDGGHKSPRPGVGQQKLFDA